MRLEVPLCRQTTDFTCGACATLMVWRYFDKKVQLSKQNEFLIWTEIVALPFKFSSPYRIAEFFIKRGFETELLMKQETSSTGNTLLECCQVDVAERDLFLDFFKAYNAILKRCVAQAILDRKPTLSDIRRALSTRSPPNCSGGFSLHCKNQGSQKPASFTSLDRRDRVRKRQISCQRFSQ